MILCKQIINDIGTQENNEGGGCNKSPVDFSAKHTPHVPLKKRINVQNRELCIKPGSNKRKKTPKGIIILKTPRNNNKTPRKNKKKEEGKKD